MKLLFIKTTAPWPQAAGHGFLNPVNAMPERLPDNAPLSADECRLQDLLAAIVGQDQAAFAALYGQLADRVYGLALSITRRVTLAEEVTEDAFWQIWRQAPRFDPDRGPALAWIMTIVRSRALDALRKQEPVATDSEPPELAAAVADNPADLLLAVEENSRIHAALEGLAPIPRQLVALAFLRGLSHDEIASHTGLPLGTVKSHIRRALLDLKQSLQADQ